MSSSRRTFLLTGAALPVTGLPQTARSSAPAVRHRVLGRTGLKVTELGFGSEAVSDISVFERALDCGINFFDTARSYQGGNAEQILGAALKGKRDRAVLCTRSYADNARQMALDLDTSLKALGTDHVDVWYIGNKDRPDQITPEMLEVQRSAQNAGKLRFRGLSSHRVVNVVEFVIEQKIDVVQIPYNFAIGTRRDPFNLPSANLDAALDRLKSAGIGVVAMKVMAGGYRGARPLAPVPSIRWALRDDRVHTTSVRMTDMEQLNENLHAMSGRYSDADAKMLAAYTESVRPVLCRMCGACDDKCPNGTPVADVVRSVMYAEGYGHYEMGLAAFQRCGGNLECGRCGECVVSCPNGVAIAERMRRAERLFC